MNSFATLVIRIIFLVPVCISLPVIDGDGPSSSTQTLTDAMIYLMRYGYMDINTGGGERMSAPLLSSDGLKDYISKFQNFAGLEVTGELDQKTVFLMKQPRCGVKDVVHDNSATTRRKRYALQGSRWRVRNITYKISKYPRFNRMSKADIDAEVAMAWRVWSNVTELSFEQKQGGKVHVDIRFEDGEHGDGDAFDGNGGTLAHAFFPVYGGDVHFDNAETWTMGVRAGTNLLQTAAHEFGHSLGLSHSKQYRALMAPFYRGYQKQVTLDDDDVVAVQALYGVKTNRIVPKIGNIPRETKPPDEDLCKNSTIDSIITMEDGTYAFKGNMFWKLTEDSVLPGYPKNISKFWKGLPGKIDASFTWSNGKSFFFKDKKYWRFTNGKMDTSYPRLIKKGFDGIPDNVDAAFVWSGNEKIYFFKGSQYWRFDPEKRPPVSSGYPKPISNWEGIPDDVDDALQYDNGYTYFFKKGEYYRFNDRHFKVDDADPPFPRPAGYWWFGCDTLSQPLKAENSLEMFANEDDNDDIIDEFDDEWRQSTHLLNLAEAQRNCGSNNKIFNLIVPIFSTFCVMIDLARL